MIVKFLYPEIPEFGSKGKFSCTVRGMAVDGMYVSWQSSQWQDYIRQTETSYREAEALQTEFEAAAGPASSSVKQKARPKKLCFDNCKPLLPPHMHLFNDTDEYRLRVVYGKDCKPTHMVYNDGVNTTHECLRFLI